MDIEIIFEDGTCIDYFNIKKYIYLCDEYVHKIVTSDNEKVTFPDCYVYQLCIVPKS